MWGALRRAGTAGVVAFALLVAAPAAYAVPPNDNWANREVIAALPFTDTEPDVATATVEATDPVVACRVAIPGQGGNTLWYSYTTGSATEYVTISTATSDYDTAVSVYEGAPGSFRLTHGGCNDDAGERGLIPVAHHRCAVEGQHDVLDRGLAPPAGRLPLDAAPQRRGGGHVSGDQDRRHRRRGVRRRLLAARGRQRRQRDAGRGADPRRHVHADRHRR